MDHPQSQPPHQEHPPPAYHPGEVQQVPVMEDKMNAPAPPSHPAVVDAPTSSMNEHTQPPHTEAHPPVADTSGSSMPPHPAVPSTSEEPDGVHFMRDPHKLIAYLVSFPMPHLKDQSAANKIPPRFLVYTPPPPPIGAPPPGEKEGRVHKLQRRWQDEVREAKTSQVKVLSFKGVKGRATKGIDYVMGQTKSTGLEFLNRIPGNSEAPASGGSTSKKGAMPAGTAAPGVSVPAGAPPHDDIMHDKHSNDGVHEDEMTKKTVGLEELVLIYPSSITKSQEELRAEFLGNVMRTKSKAERDAVIATGLIPVSIAIDLLAIVVWPFGGLAEIDTVFALASLRGAKTARSVTKRLNSSGSEGSGGSDGMMEKMNAMMPSMSSDHKLKLTFVPSSQVLLLDKFLANECHLKDMKLFPAVNMVPTEADVINAIGWSPSQTGGETKNWEDEQWELQEVKDDVKNVMKKGAREWDKWVMAYEKNPKKALGNQK